MRDDEEVSEEPVDPTRALEPRYDPRGVPAYSQVQDPAEAAPDSTRMMQTAPPPTGPASEARSSTELARGSQKQRRRERDQQAERKAQRLLIGVFVAIGAAGFLVINSGIFDEPEKPAPDPQAALQAPQDNLQKPVVPPQPIKRGVPDETPDIPALGSLRSEGLTIAAEGLPEVVAVDPPMPPALLAGIETCRFAYGVWEFSPNRAFRFLTTCAALEGQILVGAYEVRGSQIHTSPLNAEGVQLVSTFEVEKPSRVRTEVTIPLRDGTLVKLEVRQRLTTMRPGLEGDGFYRTYAGKNTVQIQGLPPPGAAPAPRPEAAPAAAPRQDKAAKDPVLELLEGGN